MRTVITGNCYEHAAKFFLALKGQMIGGELPQDSSVMLCHGFITYDSGRKINHAWVESEKMGKVFDVAAQVNYAFDQFYNWNVRVFAYYKDPALILKLHNQTDSWGPILWLDALGRKDQAIKIQNEMQMAFKTTGHISARQTVLKKGGRRSVPAGDFPASQEG